MANLDHTKSESVIFNIQVGKGKTRACYQLIEHYAKLDYVVLVLSPFKRLVEKDCKELKKKGLEVYNYEDLPATMAAAAQPGYHFNFLPHVEHTIHVMTINCLLQNPGEDSIDQARIKQDFLSGILQKCHEVDKKVVMFFDEIHESIDNFKDEYVPNIFRWHGLVHKTFVSSATFTPASIPVLKYIAALTGEKISIYETPRIMIDQPVSLHLHILEQKFSDKHLSSLAHLKNVIDNRQGKKVNILVGYKKVVSALQNIGDHPEDEALIQAILSLDPNVITGDKDNTFKQDRNNFGTAFKTGVDIEDSDSIFVCLLPCVGGNNKEYGIFSDGIPSIIQSMARVRRLGHVHVFMPKPSAVIDLGQTSILLGNDLISATDDEDYRTQNSHMERLFKSFKKLRDRVRDAIRLLHSVQSKNGLQLGYSYPTFNSYLKRSGRKLLHNQYSYGKELSAYILWAALNDQFCNAKLTEITYTYTPKKIVSLAKETSADTWESLLSASLINEVRSHDLPSAVQLLLNGIDEDSQENATPLQFEIGGKRVTVSEIKGYPSLVQKLISVYVSKVTSGQIADLSKEDYLLACTVKAGLLPDFEITTQRIRLFKELDVLRQSFLATIQRLCQQNDSQEKIIHREAWKLLNDTFVQDCINLFKSLAKEDSLFNGRIYSLFTKVDEVTDLQDKKEALYREFKKCFTNVTSIRRMYNKKKDEFYLVDGNLEKVPSPMLSSLPLL